jgi:hypothetical protein
VHGCRVVAQDRERCGHEDHRGLARRLRQHGAAEVRERPPQLELPRRRGRPARECHAEREGLEAAAEALLELVDVADLGLQIVRVRGERFPVE